MSALPICSRLLREAASPLPSLVLRCLALKWVTQSPRMVAVWMGSMEHKEHALIGSSPTFDFADKFVKQNAHFGNEELTQKR